MELFHSYESKNILFLSLLCMTFVLIQIYIVFVFIYFQVLLWLQILLGQTKMLKNTTKNLY